MLEAIFWVVVGAFVGWTIPQPEWAKKAQAFVTEKIKSFFSSTQG